MKTIILATEAAAGVALTTNAISHFGPPSIRAIAAALIIAGAILLIHLLRHPTPPEA